MKVKRLICPRPACGSERKVISDKLNLHEYFEEITYELCDSEACCEWFSSPEQRLLRAMFGERR